MKRLLSIFIIVCALSACENYGHGYNPSPESNPIMFDMAETRAAITEDDIMANGFGVYAFVTNAEGTSYESLFENSPEKVYRQDDKWTYDNTKFWLGNRAYQFFGVYPFDAQYNITTDISGNPTGISHTFTTPATADEDLVLARATYDTSVTEAPQTVEMNFQHMLSKVSINVWRDGAKHQNDEMRVKSAMLSNICKTATYNSTTNAWTPTQNEKMTKVGENIDPTTNIGAVVQKDGSLTYSGKSSTPFGELMLLPQTIGSTLTDKVLLTIEYELLRQNATEWESATLEAELPNITWRAGQRYTYNVVLSQVKYITVYFIQTKVDPWGTPQVGGTVIIK